MQYPLRENTEKFSPLQIAKIYLIASTMAFVAGYINSAILIEFSIPVSQMSGVASYLSEHAYALNLSLLGTSLMILFMFITGSFISGLLIGQTPFYQTPNYGYGLLINCLLLINAALFSIQDSMMPLLLTSLACGIQNALVASYKGLQLRTTHMTGNATDIGVHLANTITKKAPWSWQSNVLAVLIVGYIIGGIIGIYAHLSYPQWSLIYPAILSGTLGLIYLKNYRLKAQKTKL